MRSRGIAAELVAKQIESVFRAKGYQFFDGGKPWNLNIVGVRSGVKVANQFDDHVLAVYRNEEGEMVVDAYTATTDPGKKYLQRPINVKGAAILHPGQYRSSHKIGMHRGQYEALVQQGAAVKVWRDDNRDDVLDHLPDEIHEGWYGINIHRAHPLRELERVNGYSAGCQVFASPTDFSEFMQTCRRSAKIYGNLFTYTLVDESDFGIDLADVG